MKGLKEDKRGLLGAGEVLFLDQGVGYMGVHFVKSIQVCIQDSPTLLCAYNPLIKAYTQ